MADPIRERLAADLALGALQPLDAYRRLFPGQDEQVARAWSDAKAAAPSTGHMEEATRSVISLEALRDPGFARLQVAERLGEGGMGEVLAVRDEVLRRDLAMKRVREPGLLDAPAADPGDGEPQATMLARRLLEEAQITAQLDHPGVVPVHELGLDPTGRPYFTMKRVRGRTLEEVFRLVGQGREWSLARAVQVFVRICETLAYAHKKGVVHRDVKPANVMVGRYGEVYLMDWGLAKVRGDAAPGSDAPAPGASGVISTHASDLLRAGRALTLDGQIVGTPGYLAPEQLAGATPDARSDVYAVGAMLYEMLAGHAPYGEPEALADVRKRVLRQLTDAPLPLAERAPQAPPELVAIAEKAMARDPDRRFSTVEALADELHAFLEGRVVHSHRTGLWIELRKWVRRNRWAAAGIVVGLLAVVATTAAFVAQQRSAAVAIGVQRDRAQGEAERALAAGRRAEGLRLAAQSRLVEDPGLALALSVEAGRRAPGAAASGAIYAALRQHHEWRYFPGHESYVAFCRWTSDGSRLVSADETGLVVVWDVAGDAPLHWFEGALGTKIVSLALSPDDLLAATAHDDGAVRVWDLRAGKTVGSLPVKATSVCFATANRLVVAGEDGKVEAFEPRGGARTSLHEAPGPARLAEGHVPGAAQVAVTWPGRLALLSLEGGAPVTASGPESPVAPRAVVSAAAGLALVHWGERDARVHDLTTGEEIATFGGPEEQVVGAAWSGDGKRLALALSPARGGPQVAVIDVRTAARVATVEADAASGLSVSKSGDGVAAVGRAFATWIDLTAEPRLVPLRGHRYTVQDGALSPDGRFLATASHDCTVRVWALAPEDERAGLVSRAAAGQLVQGWSQDLTRALVAVPGKDGTPGALEVLDTASGRVVARFDADVSTLGTAGLDATGSRAWWIAGRDWRVMDVATGASLRAARLEGLPEGRHSVFPSPDGKLVAVNHDAGVSVFDQTTGAKRGRVAEGRGAVRPTWAPDSTHLVVAHPPEALSALYRFDTPEPLREFVGHTGFVTDAEADPRMRWVVSVAADTSLRVFDFTTARLLRTFRGLPLRGANFEFGPGGDVIAVNTSKHVLLDAREGSELREIATLERAPDAQLVLLPDGTRFGIVDRAQRARIWGLDAVAAGLQALRRPVLRLDGVQDYVPDEADPLEARWLARSDPWWSLERAVRRLQQGRLDEAEQALDQAAAARPDWAAPDLERARLVAARGTARGLPADATVPEIVRWLESARRKGWERLPLRRWFEPPAELRPYLEDERLLVVLRELELAPTGR